MSFNFTKEQRRVAPQKPVIAWNKVAIVVAAPDEEAEAYGVPIAGKTGNFLFAVCKAAGLDPQATLIIPMYPCKVARNHYIPVDNPMLDEPKMKLRQLLETWKPNIVVWLGPAIGYAKAKCPQTWAGATAYGAAWRGSLFLADGATPFYGIKSICTYEPVSVLREYQLMPLMQFDLKRAASEALSPELLLPTLSIATFLAADEICLRLDTWPSGHPLCLDIEGGLPINMVHPKAVAKLSKGARLGRYNWSCVGICGTSGAAFTIPWLRYSDIDCARMLRAFARLMARTDVPKVLQNQLYDNFCLSYGYGIPILNVTQDVMIKSYEVYAELPRGLATQASIWTKIPHWKDDSMYVDRGEGLYRGCAIDVIATMEISRAQDAVLHGSGLTHYHKTISLQKPFLYMELRGIRYDQENANKLAAETQADLDAVGAEIERLAGMSLRGPAGSLSSKKLCECLYSRWGYPPQYKKEHGRKTDKLTADKEALLRLARGRETDPLLAGILRHRHLEGTRETLAITADPDGRVRAGYSLEAETGRVKCYTSPTGSGANLQTIQSQLRQNYIADPGHSFFQCDLEGADGWTVAAHCARLGDRNMLEDYLIGMKPAKLIALMYVTGACINDMSRSDVKWLHDNLFPIVSKSVGSWVYMGSKRVQHGSNYLMMIPTMQLNVLIDSYKVTGKPIYLDSAAAVELQQNYFARYPGVQIWHNFSESALVATGKLTASSGNIRVFFGRRFGPELKVTLREYLAHEPQHNTTWATNLAMIKLWEDPANRVVKVLSPTAVVSGDGTTHIIHGIERKLVPGSLLIEPLHQVHDALCGQFPTCIRTWAAARIRSYFNNTLTIAQQDIIIPFEGKYGPSWGQQPYKI